MVRYNNFAWLLLAFVLPTPADAQFGYPGRGCNRCQTQRQRFVPQYIPQPVMQVPVCPQVQTTYRQERYTTYQPVTRTHVRREAVQVNVPVITHKQVRVDEGGYQMVWVPKVTTKTVAQTTIQKQVRYRDVPYQVVENIPQVHTRLVPQQTFAYQPTMVAVATPSYQSNSFPTVPTPIVSTIPPAKVAQVPTPKQATNAVEEKWIKVPQKQAKTEQAEVSAEIELQNFESSVPVKSAKGMFSRPSSTATALRTRRIY